MGCTSAVHVEFRSIGIRYQTDPPVTRNHVVASPSTLLPDGPLAVIVVEVALPVLSDRNGS
jgi:hypothetical protein